MNYLKIVFDYLECHIKHPQSNGMVERIIKTVKTIIKCLYNNNGVNLALLELMDCSIDQNYLQHHFFEVN